MPKKPYSPMASYAKLREVEKLLQTANTADDVRKIVTKHGPQVGYKAFCYMLGGKMSAAAMKADEACVEAAKLEQKGDIEAAQAIYKDVIAVHPDHPLAMGKVS